jgi:hypothetical protein
MASRKITAATQPDREIELTETTYHVSADNTAKVTYHQRWRALTAAGRVAVSQIKIPYLAAFQDVENNLHQDRKKGWFGC